MTDGGAWFDGARFGMFVHWSFISMRGLELSWPLVGGLGALPAASDVPVEDYYRNALDFSPSPGSAESWADLAARAGMRYAVMTAKHHDGFCMFRTDHSAFSIAQTAYRGDLVGEYVHAFRSRGLRVGLYYSVSDWRHPDYPAFTEADKPYRFGQHRRPEPGAWERYLADMFGQITDLLTNYGTIDVLWFDGGWERGADEWRSADLEALIRRLQPDILVNDRLPGVGDYATPEQFVPAQPLQGRWETCMTMNRSWGYCPADEAYKSSRRLVHTLVETASRGGNLLLNVSPGPDGFLPVEQVSRLEDVAAWIARNGASIYDTRPGFEPWQAYGASTRDDQVVYVHLLLRPYDQFDIRGVPIRRVRSVRHVASGRELSFSRSASAIDLLFGSDPVGEVHVSIPAELVDEFATTIAVTIEPEAR